MNLADVDSLSNEQATALLYDYDLVLREKQKLPDLSKPWRTWLVLAGRSFGKTYAGSKAVHELVMRNGYRNVGLVGPDMSDTRGTMIQKISGIMNTCPPWEKPRYYKSDKIALRWPNGAIASVYGSTDEDDIRGDNTDLLWLDEICSWKRMEETYTQAMLTNRLGDHPRVIITTTPKPSKLLKMILKSPDTIVTTGDTFENTTMSDAALDFFKRMYEGTKIGRQELYAEVLEDNEGALFKIDDIDAPRIRDGNKEDIIKHCQRIVVSIDPAVTNNDESDSTGIVVCGKLDDRYGVVLEDATMKGSPNEWASQAIALYYKYKADRIIAEVNNGGDLVENTLRMIDRHVSYSSVRATRGKVRRAEPIAALYEQHRIKHFGYHKQLEQQMTEWQVGDSSPDRLDSLVWGLTELFVSSGTMQQKLIQMSV